MSEADGEKIPDGINGDALIAYLADTVPDFDSQGLTIELIAGGLSNLTYFLTGADRTIVLRRPPLGHVLATAHDMGREFRVITALRASIPVPQSIAYCEDVELIGSPFYLMERVDGVVMRDGRELVALGPEEPARISGNLVSVLGQLHALDPSDVGLTDFGRPEGFLERQVRRWAKQLDASRSRDIDGIDSLLERLSSAIPTTQRDAIVHGDYRLDNTIFAPTADGHHELAAVVDWEMSTLGDPLTDIGLFCIYWDGTASGQLVPTPDVEATIEGLPTSDDLVAIYADASGLDLTPLPWYTAFASFKLAVILEGIYYRHSQGKTLGEGFDVVGGYVAPLVQGGHNRLDEGGI